MRTALLQGGTVKAFIVKPDGRVIPFETELGALEPSEREILASGCLINYYRS